MSLSYSLDVSNLNNLSNLAQALISLGDNGTTDIFKVDGFGRFLSPTKPGQDLFPTGEYIIRDGMYINGHFVYVGSYRAYCRDLFGDGNNGYAWDGFIMVCRGYSLEALPLIKEVNGEFQGQEGFGFLPMRMPFEVNPGASGDSSAISSDSSVGLHSLDVFKNQDDITVTGDDKNIRIITCGFQRVNPSVESVPTGMDYVANLYLAFLLEAQTIDTIDNVQFQTWEYRKDNVMQVTWEASQTGHADNTEASGRFGMLRDLDQWISANSLITTRTYDFPTWETGTSPEDNTDGDTRAISFNYYPRRFFDISCFSNTSVDSTNTVESPFYLAGDFSMDSNNDGSIDDTCPSFIGCAYPFGLFLQAIEGTTPYDTLGPFMNSSPAMATSLADGDGWAREDTAVSYDLSGAWACNVLVPYEDTGSIDFDFLPLSYIAVNDVTHSGSTYGEIYTFQESPLNPAFLIYAFAVETGAFTTATSISLPTRWYNKATQFRTFTVQEEDVGKVGTSDTETGEFFPTTGSLFDEDAQEYLGIDGNYQRYGSFTNPLAPNQPQGTRSGAAYGFLGIRTGTGPIAIMFDSGNGTLTEPESDLDYDYTLTILAEGENINDNHLTSPTSTTRIITNCGWDNDRDQWLFCTSDSTGFGVISVASDFTTASNNLGFLDQTAVFSSSPSNIPSTATASFYTPITMSNSLDGWTFFGVLDTDTNVRFGIKPPVLGSAVSKTVDVDPSDPGTEFVTYDTYPSNTSYFRRISGTTGRTARVWVDYVLFDGPDAIIANKLKDKGMKVSIEAVEWFKRQIIQTGDLNITAEEIEMWMRDQQDEYKQTLKEIERQGRIRRKKKQVSAYLEGVEDQINPDFFDTEVEDFKQDFTPTTRPPTPEESRIERKKKGGYTPEQGSYYDEVFED